MMPLLIASSFIALSMAFATGRLPMTARLGERLAALEPRIRRAAPLVIAILTIAIVWYTWDAIDPIAKVHDETSYLLQADIFAKLRWTVPSPPIPDFFEQPHVQVVPAVASKYPPGHALLLALGSLVGFHALVPLLLAGMAGALVFALAARITDTWTGILTWLVWITSPLVLRFQPGYFSESTTTPLVLTSWWLLLNWRADHRNKWLYWMALAIGWGAITRPLTMLAFATPIGIVVLLDTAKHKLWKPLVVSMTIGTAVLTILPLWSAKTTGNWRVSPIEQYRLDYLPFDKIGFTADTSAPRRTVSPVLKTTYDYFLSARKEQTFAALPKTIYDRVAQLTIFLFQQDRLPFIVLALVGLVVCGGAVRFGVASGLILFAAHLPYAHWAPWAIYYIEAVPVVAVLVAIGARHLAKRFAASDQAATGAFALATLVVLAFAPQGIQKWKGDHRIRARFDRTFADLIKKVPTPAVVFIHYSTRVSQHVPEVFNYADLNAAPVWVVHDLGPRNDDLRKLAPNRKSFDFFEDELVVGIPRRPSTP